MTHRGLLKPARQRRGPRRRLARLAQRPGADISFLFAESLLYIVGRLSGLGLFCQRQNVQGTIIGKIGRPLGNTREVDRLDRTRFVGIRRLVGRADPKTINDSILFI